MQIAALGICFGRPSYGFLALGGPWRGIGQSSICPLCGHDTEDILHAIHDCSKAKDAWMLVVLAEKISRFLSDPFHIWLSTNLCCHDSLQDKAANWVLLFSDGAIAKDSRNASAGGVVRDRNGNWILGYNHFLGRCSPLEAELWSIHDGLLILLSKGKKARIQTDNLEVVKILSMDAPVDSGITILRRIKRLMRSDGQWEITYINKECNLTADRLAKISLSWKLPLQVFEVPLDSVAMTIQQDKAFRIN
ncbi:hypothetical protein J1N35_011282 [Gossypium stocksii]|uniref:RNase H type-1 domain-containing protein n=1 Tax=Gossypium stocksii TaxID=47602 RepID=A0A9D3W1U1_9ROSI|nr:hypothetical protein J1N35_011282 [Gossypium stocksii]